jgi:excisionase family DNA binding protein
MVARVNVYGNPERGGKVLKGHIEPEWVDYPTAQHLTSLSHTTLWRYVTSGDIKAARIGRSVRINLPSLQQFMQKKAGGQ